MINMLKTYAIFISVETNWTWIEFFAIKMIVNYYICPICNISLFANEGLYILLLKIYVIKQKIMKNSKFMEQNFTI